MADCCTTWEVSSCGVYTRKWPATDHLTVIRNFSISTFTISDTLTCCSNCHSTDHTKKEMIVPWMPWNTGRLSTSLLNNNVCFRASRCRPQACPRFGADCETKIRVLVEGWRGRGGWVSGVGVMQVTSQYPVGGKNVWAAHSIVTRRKDIVNVGIL